MILDTIYLPTALQPNPGYMGGSVFNVFSALFLTHVKRGSVILEERHVIDIFLKLRGQMRGKDVIHSRKKTVFLTLRWCSPYVSFAKSTASWMRISAFANWRRTTLDLLACRSTSNKIRGERPLFKSWNDQWIV